jgi:hypothetical protein
MCFCWIIHLCETPVATFSCQSWKLLSYFPTKKDIEDCPKMDLPKFNGMLISPIEIATNWGGPADHY